MDNLDDSENNAKVSDSAYSNSCSNSQSRRSHSSKSTRSGSNSSRSSGYGGQKSGYSANSGQPADKRIKEKDVKKKKQAHVEQIPEDQSELEERPGEEPPVAETISEETCNVARTPTPLLAEVDKESDRMDIATPDLSSTKDEVSYGNTAYGNFGSPRGTIACTDGFSCVISMHDGVVMYTTSSLTAALGFPKEMWIGRSFIDFVHPRDRNTFASHITNGLAVPKNDNGTVEEVPASQNTVCTMVCRIRKYRNLATGFEIKERLVTFMPFFLKFSFKRISDEEGKVIYLVIQATPIFSAFKAPNELVPHAVPFVIRHAANGRMEYVDPESVPYLGYLPQDLVDQDALQLYHPDDLPYLLLVYETIVKEGGLPRSKPYRILAQNGDFIRVETEWTTFINPWSKMLEFVTGKHHIIEGPDNPDVFQTEPEKKQKISEEENSNIHILRETILRIMNEVLTKPAEAAKQHMTKRCQDLASFMESLMEEQPKVDDELRLEIQDADQSYYERDSVMLGGISPHHDHHDSKSSTETPLSYNQLNYNNTLQRYFDCHEPYPYEECGTEAVENVPAVRKLKYDTATRMSPVAQSSRDFGDMSSVESGCMFGGNSPMAVNGDYPLVRLTESLLNKHNSEMEKELMKNYRESRSSSKGERKKASNKNRQKKKEHLARCNAAFQPTSVINTTVNEQPHGVKRASNQEYPPVGMRKHHCSFPRQSRRRKSINTAAQVSSTITTTVATTPWHGNTFILGIPQQMSIMPAMPGMIPMYYAPAAQPAPMPPSNMNNGTPGHTLQFQPPMQCMMYGQAVYGSPIMYSSISPQMQYVLAQNLPPPSAHDTTVNNPLGLASNNYVEACKQTIPVKTRSRAGSLWRDKKLKINSTNVHLGSAADSSSSSNALNGSMEAVPESTPSSGSKVKGSEETVDRTDGGSSYSSFYSSFFKTESGSAEDSGDLKRAAEMNDRKALGTKNKYYELPPVKNFAKRKMDPPWLEEVCVTSELIYKYQIVTKSAEEVLQADKMKLTNLEQPSLVNDQLGQLYLDLQLEGVAARLSLEEGITSSSSSGDEAANISPKVRRKREYSKLVMIYEEDAPMPPPQEDIPSITVTPSTSTMETNS